jgi:hypothetical protein
MERYQFARANIRPDLATAGADRVGTRQVGLRIPALVLLPAVTAGSIGRRRRRATE